MKKAASLAIAGIPGVSAALDALQEVAADVRLAQYQHYRAARAGSQLCLKILLTPSGLYRSDKLVEISQRTEPLAVASGS